MVDYSEVWIKNKYDFLFIPSSLYTQQSCPNSNPAIIMTRGFPALLQNRFDLYYQRLVARNVPYQHSLNSLIS